MKEKLAKLFFSKRLLEQQEFPKDLHKNLSKSNVQAIARSNFRNKFLDVVTEKIALEFPKRSVNLFDSQDLDDHILIKGSIFIFSEDEIVQLINEIEQMLANSPVYDKG